MRVHSLPKLNGGRLIKTICTWTVGETDCQWYSGGHRLAGVRMHVLLTFNYPRVHHHHHSVVIGGQLIKESRKLLL